MTIPAGQSSVRVEFVPTNLFAEPGVPAYQYQVKLLPDATNPATQIPFDFNAASTNPTTGQATPLPSTQPVWQHGLVVVNTNFRTLSDDELNALVQDLSNLDPTVRESAQSQLRDWITSDPTIDDYNLINQWIQENNNTPSITTFLNGLLSKYYPWGNSIQLVANANRITLLLPPRFVPDIGPNTYFEVAIDPSPQLAKFDVPAGESPSDVLTALNSGAIPDILIEPKQTSVLSIQFTIVEKRIVAGQPNTVGDPIQEDLHFTILRTDIQ